jgi:hypothetical protein
MKKSVSKATATFVCRSDFLGLFGALLGSGFGAVVLAAVLGELPAFDFQEMLGMNLAIFGFPIVAARLTFNNDLLAFFSQGSEALPDFLNLNA